MSFQGSEAEGVNYGGSRQLYYASVGRRRAEFGEDSEDVVADAGNNADL